MYIAGGVLLNATMYKGGVGEAESSDTGESEARY